MATKKKSKKKSKTKSKKKSKQSTKSKPAKKKAKPKAKPKKIAKKKASRKRRNSMAYGVRTMGPLRLAAVVAADPGAAWNAMFPLMKERALQGQALAAFTMADGKIKSYAASVEVKEGDAIDAPLVEQRIDASSYACTSFVGTYDKLGETWAWFLEHVKNIGHTIDMSRPFLEIYTSDGKRAADGLPRTELCVPV
jgi:predicted transcriptional regulator YdeE